MTQTVDLPLASTRTDEHRLVGGVCLAHFVSHYYIMLLAPLFIFVREDYGVSYTDLGLAFTAFNVVSTVLQTPMGFIVDRVSARLVLIGGLLLGAAAFAVAGVVHSYWVFIAMFAVAGIANTVYHPADYALLSEHLPPERTSRAFSLHTFAGMVGNAAAPPTLLFMQGIVGWRGAFVGAAVLGVVAALVFMLLLPGDRAPAKPHAKPRKAAAAEASSSDTWKLLLSLPILLNLVFFVLLSFCGNGLYNYLVVTLGALHGTPPAIANTALTGLLVMSAIGVLAGGMLAGWSPRHGLVASCGMLATAIVCALVGLVDFGALALLLMMSAAGFFSGLAMPSRDMIVRAVTPPGAYGRVFGFVTTGFNLGGIVSPIIFGQLLDRGYPREIFFVMAAAALLAIGTVAITTTRKREA